jgi:c-di-GMP-related signal transduction protein
VDRSAAGRGIAEKFIARQPVFDSHRVLYGYELLWQEFEQATALISVPQEAVSELYVRSWNGRRLCWPATK